MAFTSIAGLLSAAQGIPLWQAIQADDCSDRGVIPQASFDKMSTLWAAMKASVSSYDPARRSASGLVGGDGGKMSRVEDTLCGPFLQSVMATALMVGECNACMGRIVAAPTAGSSGVMPAVLLPYQERWNVSDEEMVKALFVAAGFGQVIAARASISGAEGGCQAEVGSASAMAAAALVHLRGGTPQQMAAACATAIQNLLGLVCDPVGGLVEVPCIKRNVIGAVGAMAAADLALAGIENVIPCDEVIDAMGAVGRALPCTLRETGEGGLAVTPTARRLTENIFAKG